MEVFEPGTEAGKTQAKSADAQMSRRGLLSLCAATLITAATPAFPTTFNVARGGGNIRRLSMWSDKTGESINIIYWVDGVYVPDALSEINYFMRDWRQDKFVRMDTNNLDILAATHKILDASEPFELLSGYRTKATNRQLRRQSRGVAKHSLHMYGKAADVRLKGFSSSNIAKAARICKSGGVGVYRRSGFVHIDCGKIRSWIS